jgi:ribosome-binding protein aMBF1 (putative translation factor)
MHIATIRNSYAEGTSYQRSLIRQNLEKVVTQQIPDGFDPLLAKEMRGKLSMNDLAEQIGISQSMICSYERGDIPNEERSRQARKYLVWYNSQKKKTVT